MPRINETHLHTLTECEFLFIPVRTQQLNSSKRVVHGIQRHIWLLALAQRLAGAPLCFKFLDVRTVTQHDAAQRSSSLGGVDLAGKTARAQQRQQTGMVDMGMCQQNVIHGARRTGDLFIDVDIASLFHAEIHKDLFGTDFQIGAASGDFVRCADKFNFHTGFLPFERR